MITVRRYVVNGAGVSIARGPGRSITVQTNPVRTQIVMASGVRGYRGEVGPMGDTGPQGPAGSVLTGASSVTVSGLSWSETVQAVGVSSSMIIVPSLAPTGDTDENETDMLDLSSMSALAGEGEITFTLAFRENTSGPINLQWIAV